MNAEHVQSAISAVSSALTTSNEGDEITEVREEKEQQRGEVRKGCNSSEVLSQSSPTGVPGPVIFGWLMGCRMRDVSTLHSGTRSPWASLNWRHRRVHPSKPRSSTQMVSCLTPYSMGNGLNKIATPPSPSPVSDVIIETIQHPHGIGPTKPVIMVPISNFSIVPHTRTMVAQYCREHIKVLDMTPSEHTTTFHHPSTLISGIVAFSSTILSCFLSFFRLSEATRASP
jgi:hypothetical protein